MKPSLNARQSHQEELDQRAALVQIQQWEVKARRRDFHRQDHQNHARLGGICNLFGVELAEIINTNSCQAQSCSLDHERRVNTSKRRRKWKQTAEEC